MTARARLAQRARRAVPGLARSYAELASVSPSKDEMDTIEKDVIRSGREDLGVSDSDFTAFGASLQRVLWAWCALRPEVGYCQAMNSLAAALLVSLDYAEDHALAALGLLVDTLPRDFFVPSPPLRGCLVEVRALLLLYEQLEPRLFAAPAATAPLRDAVSIVATQWFLSLWSGTLPLRLMPVTAPPARRRHAPHPANTHSQPCLTGGMGDAAR